MEATMRVMSWLMLVPVLAVPVAAQGSRPATRPSAADERARRVRAPFEGRSLPGRDVTGGTAWLPITDAPYSRPGELRHRVSEKDLVIGLTGGGQARAYPIKMLGGPQREIVNDRLADLPYAVNW